MTIAGLAVVAAGRRLAASATSKGWFTVYGGLCSDGNATALFVLSGYGVQG
jgi:hypothetical protein